MTISCSHNWSSSSHSLALEPTHRLQGLALSIVKQGHCRLTTEKAGVREVMLVEELRVTQSKCWHRSGLQQSLSVQTD